jgi:AcrR family transcriptional regulator
VSRRRAGELRPRKSPSQARSRATVATLLEAAARVFASRGYAGATTNHIADAAGVSVGSLYEYYPNKDALLVALVDAHITEGQALLDAVAARVLSPSCSLRDAVACLVEAMIDLHARDRKLHRVLFEETPLPPRVRRRLEDAERTMAERLSRYLAGRPEVTVPDEDLAATILVQTIEALTHRLVIHGEPAEHPAQEAEMVTLITAYLTASR